MEGSRRARPSDTQTHTHTARTVPLRRTDKPTRKRMIPILRVAQVRELREAVWVARVMLQMDTALHRVKSVRMRSHSRRIRRKGRPDIRRSGRKQASNAVLFDRPHLNGSTCSPAYCYCHLFF